MLLSPPFHSLLIFSQPHKPSAPAPAPTPLPTYLTYNPTHFILSHFTLSWQVGPISLSHATPCHPRHYFHHRYYRNKRHLLHAYAHARTRIRLTLATIVMSERLHYFTETTTTAISFDCSDSDIDSDLEDARRPASATDRAKLHTRQFQLWSDEARARQRRRGTLPSALHNTVCARPPADRQQSNLSERARMSGSTRRVVRSHSAKNLRIRVTPSSSSKSLLSDISEHNEQAQSCNAVIAHLLPSCPVSHTPLALSSKPSIVPSTLTSSTALSARTSLPCRISVPHSPAVERYHQPSTSVDSTGRNHIVRNEGDEIVVSKLQSCSNDGRPLDAHSRDLNATMCTQSLLIMEENVRLAETSRRSTSSGSRLRSNGPLSHLKLRARSSTTSGMRRSNGRPMDEDSSSPSLSRRKSFSQAVKRLPFSRLWKRS